MLIYQCIYLFDCLRKKLAHFLTIDFSKTGLFHGFPFNCDHEIAVSDRVTRKLIGKHLCRCNGKY